MVLPFVQPSNYHSNEIFPRKHKFSVLAMGCLLSVATSCTDYMQTLNQDDKLITDEDLVQDANEGGILLPLMMNRIVATTTAVQTQQNLQAESFAGYLETPTPFLNNENTTTYFMVDGWNNTAWNTSTQNVMDQWLQMWKKGYETKYPDLYAIALIIKVTAAHRLVDTFGPYPYTKYGTSAQVTFDSEEEAYTAFFADLDKAVAALKAAEAANPNADKARFREMGQIFIGGRIYQLDQAGQYDKAASGDAYIKSKTCSGENRSRKSSGSGEWWLADGRWLFGRSHDHQSILYHGQCMV
jgi:hypothetical protein